MENIQSNSRSSLIKCAARFAALGMVLASPIMTSCATFSRGSEKNTERTPLAECSGVDANKSICNAASTVNGAVSIPQDSLETNRERRHGYTWEKFTVNRAMITTENGKTVSFEEYAKVNPSNLTLFWVVYQALGRTDSSGEKIQYLYNPNYVHGKSKPGDRYLGIIVRDVKTNSGESGDFVVRTKWTGNGSGPQWIPIMANPNTVDLLQVLFRVKPGTVGEPQNDELFRSRIKEAQVGNGTDFFFERNWEPNKGISVIEFAPTTTYVIGKINPIGASKTTKK